MRLANPPTVYSYVPVHKDSSNRQSSNLQLPSLGRSLTHFQVHGANENNQSLRTRGHHRNKTEHFKDEMSNQTAHGQSTKSSSGRASSLQPLHIRRQGGSSNLRDLSPSSDSNSGQENGAPLTKPSTQNTQRQTNLSFANRQNQGRQGQRGSGNMVSFQFPENQDAPIRAPSNTAQQGHARGTSHPGSTRRQFQVQGQNEVVRVSVQVRLLLL